LNFRGNKQVIVGRYYRFYRLRKKEYDTTEYELLKVKGNHLYFKGFDGRGHKDYFKEFFELVTKRKKKTETAPGIKSVTDRA
jgi:hypothetical protein